VALLRLSFRLIGGLCLVLASLGGCGDGTDPADPAGTGTIQIEANSSGGDIDPDGYVATLDAGGAGISLPVNASIFINALAGPHTVEIGGLALNCSVAVASQIATVTEGDTARVNFTVSCISTQPTVGSIRVVTSTVGSNPDPDGYQFAVDGAAPQPIGTSATATLDQIPAGPHTVEISGLAPNCGIASGWLKQIDVFGGGTAQAVFPVTCYSMGPSPTGSNLSADPASISIAETSTVTVQVADATNAPLPGFQVTLSASGTGNTIIPWPSVYSSVTDANGIATFQFSSTVAEAKTLTAAVNGVALQQTGTITVVKAVSFIGLITAAPEPSTAGQTVQVTVAIGGPQLSRPSGGTVSVSSNLEPDAGCDAVPLTVDQYSSSATCEMTLTVISTHLLSATYSGDSQFEGSSSTPVEHVVIAP
jgi:Bacterial Ig-like domain (group 1)/Bacterial Ig-like domain (group 3)